MINTKLHNIAVRKLRTLRGCCCYCTDRYGM